MPVTIPRSSAALLTNLVDYAGLYPPAKLGMSAAVDNYATYLRSQESWMLGRFICPVSRLEELRRESRGLLPTTDTHGEPAAQDDDLAPAQAPWRISAIIDGDLDEDLDAIFAFNHEHQQPRNGLANIDAIELKAGSPAAIDDALDSIPEEVYPFFEFPLAGDIRGFIAALSGSDAAAKIRTGGVSPDAFPSCHAIAAFLIAASQADVPFKATAGLHHPIRSEHPLTYEPNCPRGVMHGFLNLFLAACLVRSAQPTPTADSIANLLAEQSASAFRVSGDSIQWINGSAGGGGGARAVLSVTADQIRDTRETFATSFGSCSFDEPVEDLRAIKWL
ncbi:MAG: hypothetical protein AB7G11_01410 [Phycisphaerales bacterium]